MVSLPRSSAGGRLGPTVPLLLPHRGAHVALEYVKAGTLLHPARIVGRLGASDVQDVSLTLEDYEALVGVLGYELHLHPELVKRVAVQAQGEATIENDRRPPAPGRSRSTAR